MHHHEPTREPRPADAYHTGTENKAASADEAQSSNDWQAPTVSSPIKATVHMPGSKSATNRALVLAYLAEGPSTLRSPLRSRDTLLMVEALSALGADIHEGDESDTWQISPGGAILHGHAERPASTRTVDCGLAGTVMRFVPPLATLQHGDTRFIGDPSAGRRPMDPLLTALRQLGAEIDDEGRSALPFTVHGQGALRGGEVSIDASSSSQFVSALLLAGARFTNGVTVRHTGAALPSTPHIAMTVGMLRELGAEVEATSAYSPASSRHSTSAGEATSWRIAPASIPGHHYQIEPDLSNAAPFLAAALITDGAVTIPGWPASTTQAGDALRALLAELGARIGFSQQGLTVSGGGTIYGIDVDLHDVGELTPVIASLCALATRRSRLRGIAHLRGHETNRLAALAHEINGLGGHVTETDDGLIIDPMPLHGGVFGTYHDHRMAQAGAVLGLAVPGVMVEDIATTSKTLPDFPGMWRAMVTGKKSDR